MLYFLQTQCVLVNMQINRIRRHYSFMETDLKEPGQRLISTICCIIIMLCAAVSAWV